MTLSAGAPVGDDTASSTSATAASLTQAHVIAWALTLVAIVGVIVLAALGKPIPEALYLLGGVTGGSGAALSLPPGK